MAHSGAFRKKRAHPRNARGTLHSSDFRAFKVVSASTKSQSTHARLPLRSSGPPSGTAQGRTDGGSTAGYSQHGRDFEVCDSYSSANPFEGIREFSDQAKCLRLFACARFLHAIESHTSKSLPRSCTAAAKPQSTHARSPLWAPGRHQVRRGVCRWRFDSGRSFSPIIPELNLAARVRGASDRG